MLSAKRQLAYYIRVIHYLMQRLGVQEIRVPVRELENLSDVGTFYDEKTKELLIALPDAPKPPTT